jgi:signal transduction histidine kinase/streptogramin lyase
VRRNRAPLWAAAALVSIFARNGWALDPHKSLTQYSRTVWTQQHGLPEDTIRAAAQTSDGYLWLGTDEGLARFDGYDFTVFNKANADLPSNSVTALAAAPDGSLWIGTSNGLVQYRDKQFHTYTVKSGLPDDAIGSLYTDRAGAVWIVAGSSLSRYQSGAFHNFVPGPLLPITSVRAVREDNHGDLWVAGLTAVGKMSGGRFAPVLGSGDLRDGFIVTGMLFDSADRLWLAGNIGIRVRSPNGQVRSYGVADGLPDAFVRAIWLDRDGNVWAGTNGGLARLEGSRFVTAHDGSSRDHEQVRCLFEDREGDIWVGANNGLTRLRDDIFTVYGKPEGLPSDEPNAVFQDRAGRIWIGFHDSGLMLFAGASSRVYTTRDGLPNNEVFSIRQARDGDLLIATRGGFVRMHEGRLTTFVPPDPVHRANVFDALEDSTGEVWLAAPVGLGILRDRRFHIVIPGGVLLVNAVVTLCQGHDGAIWAGTYGKGLWHIQGPDRRLYTVADGLSSDQIRSLYEAPNGTLWIGTFGGGLDAFRGGHFQQFTAKDGLLSDNIANVSDDGSSLWLGTTRGICRVSQRLLAEFAAGKRKSLDATNYGVEDGLRSGQLPNFPVGGGGQRMSDGSLWFTTSRGLAVFDPRSHRQAGMPPIVHLVEMTADEHPVDLTHMAQLSPSVQRVQIRYTGIHLSAPELVQYSYRLDKVDPTWVRAGARRVINYNSLKHGQYRFTVRAQLPDGPSGEQSYSFILLPHFYETAWFRLLCAAVVMLAGWAVYQARLRQIRYRFALVLEERARLAREIHDTLAQGFVGISSQLDAVAMAMPEDTTPARKYLDMARRMARHSLTEARRSVMDLRSSVLEGQDLAAGLESGARMWTAGSGVEVDVQISGERIDLPQTHEQHLLRIAQEAVTNALKHAGATRISIRLHREPRKLYLRIQDNGRGFEQQDVFSSLGGHFGLLGMRERAERLGGQLRLASHPGEGTEVEVMVPLP